MGLTHSYNKAAPADKAVSFQDMYMHNADGDMETLLDIYKPEEREVSESDASSVVAGDAGLQRAGAHA